MRINLVTPFAEKDAVKALGARWDPARKVWYISDVADLTPFARWIPGLQAAADVSAGAASIAASARTTAGSPRPRARTSSHQPPVLNVPHCGCPVLPWISCEHSPGRP